MKALSQNTITDTKNASFVTMLAHINDTDLGLITPTDKTYNNRSRLSVRVILKNKFGEICVVKSLKHGYIQLPGGGIEEGETIEEAARRETREEAGYEIEDMKPLGYTIEERYGLTGEDAWRAYVYTAKAGKYVGTMLTDEEKAEGFVPVWMTIDDATKVLEQMDEKLAQTPQDQKSYNGTFANRRDLTLVKLMKAIK